MVRALWAACLVGGVAAAAADHRATGAHGALPPPAGCHLHESRFKLEIRENKSWPDESCAYAFLATTVPPLHAPHKWKVEIGASHVDADGMFHCEGTYVVTNAIVERSPCNHFSIRQTSGPTCMTDNIQLAGVEATIWSDMETFFDNASAQILGSNGQGREEIEFTTHKKNDLGPKEKVRYVERMY